MKITKSYLKQIIKEELNRIDEAYEDDYETVQVIMQTYQQYKDHPKLGFFKGKIKIYPETKSDIESLLRDGEQLYFKFPAAAIRGPESMRQGYGPDPERFLIKLNDSTQQIKDLIKQLLPTGSTPTDGITQIVQDLQQFLERFIDSQSDPILRKIYHDVSALVDADAAENVAPGRIASELRKNKGKFNKELENKKTKGGLGGLNIDNELEQYDNFINLFQEEDDKL